MNGALGAGTFRATGGRRWFAARNVLVVCQIALSLMLLVAGGLFARGAMRAAAADPGFRYERLLLASVDPGLAGYDEPRTRAVYRRVMERASLPALQLKVPIHVDAKAAANWEAAH